MFTRTHTHTHTRTHTHANIYTYTYTYTYAYTYKFKHTTHAYVRTYTRTDTHTLTQYSTRRRKIVRDLPQEREDLGKMKTKCSARSAGRKNMATAWGTYRLEHRDTGLGHRHTF